CQVCRGCGGGWIAGRRRGRGSRRTAGSQQARDGGGEAGTQEAAARAGGAIGEAMQASSSGVHANPLTWRRLFRLRLKQLYNRSSVTLRAATRLVKSAELPVQPFEVIRALHHPTIVEAGWRRAKAPFLYLCRPLGQGRC